MNTETPLLHALTREGVLINVSIRFWRGCKRLLPEDLGLQSSQVSDRLIHLGHKRLLPKEALKDLALVEGRAHALIDANTFPFLHGLGHFLPNPKLAEVSERLKELEREFWTARDAFMSRYSRLRDDAAQEWWDLAVNLGANPDRLLASVEGSFPAPNRMHRFFGFDVQLFQVALPERLNLELVTFRDQQEVMMARERAANEAAHKIRRDTEAFVSECVASLRDQTAQLCDDMLHSIGTSETGVHQKTLNRLVRFIDQFKQMNFANDREMERQLETVRRELLNRSAVEYRDNAGAKNQLVQGLSKLRDHARQLAMTDSAALVERFGGMGRRKFSLAA